MQKSRRIKQPKLHKKRLFHGRMRNARFAKFHTYAVCYRITSVRASKSCAATIALQKQQKTINFVPAAAPHGPLLCRPKDKREPNVPAMGA